MSGAQRPPRQRAPRHPKTRGQRIWAARERLGLTQRALGAQVGVGQAAVSAWEKDESQPRESLWPLLCEALGQPRRALETGIGYHGKDAPPRAAEGRAPRVVLPSIPDGVETLLISEKGLAQESMTAAQAARTLREAVKSGRPVWVVVG
ncbi:MAG TPA: helix-turn-helix transcriptional regulator [Geothrix sp.]